MASIVGALGVPHTPAFPAAVAAEGTKSETFQWFLECKNAVAEMRPDVIVMFDTDHLNTFFFDHLPVFAIGVDDAFTGPNDETPGLNERCVPSHKELAAHLRRQCVSDGFDVSMIQQFSVDHSIMVPLHFIVPDFNTPIIPVFISGHVPPLPSARRCFDLGRSICRGIGTFPDTLRIAVIGSGSFSLDVFGTMTAPKQSFGVPDPAWSESVVDLLRHGLVEELIERTLPQKLAHAGNVAGEILNWIAMLAATDGKPPMSIRHQGRFGHGYAIWSGANA